MTLIEHFERLADKARAILSSPFFILWALPLIVTWRLFASSPADPDLFARVAMGRLIIAHNAVPLTDPFAFTTTLSQWIDHEWLSGLLFYLIVSSWGDAGLVFLKLMLATLTAVCVVHASSRTTTHFPARFIWITLCILHAAAAWTSTVRCQAFTYLFVAILYWAIIEYRHHKSIFLLSLTPIMAIAWVNMHGGYALGCILIGMLVLVHVWEKRITVALLAIAAAWALVPIFTPYGFVSFATFLIDSLGMTRPGIDEWYPLHSDPSSFAMTALLSIPLIVGIILQRRSLDLIGLGALIFSAYCAFRHVRFLPFFMISAAIFGGPYVQSALDKIRTLRPQLYIASLRSGAMTVLLLLCLGAVQVVGYTFSKSSYRLDYSDFPVGAVEWLRTNHSAGRLLVDFNIGSFALWRLYPNFKISVDGRYEEAYPNETVRDSALAFRPDLAKGREAFERINPTHILLPKSHGITDPQSAFGDGWKVVYRDPSAVVLSRDSAGNVTSVSNIPQRPADMWVPQF